MGGNLIPDLTLKTRLVYWPTVLVDRCKSPVQNTMAVVVVVLATVLVIILFIVLLLGDFCSAA
jgi:hypothetical protein